MEISFQAIAFWILCQVLGLQGLRNGDVYHDRSLNKLQIKMSRSLGWKMLSNYPKEVANNMNKRFFEFNPVAFSQKPNNKPVNEERRKQFFLSPFMSSLEHIQTFSEKDNAPRFKSAYINKGEKPKDLRPFLDHFSGVKSVALHFKNPDRLSNTDKTSNEESLKEKLLPFSGISMRAFLDSHTDQSPQKDSQHFDDDRIIHALQSTWSDVPEYDRKIKLQALIDKGLDSNVFEAERPGYDQSSSNKKGGLNLNVFYHKNTKMNPELFDVTQNDGSLIIKNSQSTKTEKEKSKVGKNKAPKNYQIEQNLHDAFIKYNELISKANDNIIPTESFTISPVEDVAYTSGISKHKFDQSMGTRTQNLKTDSKPHFGFSLESLDGFQTIDNDFNDFGFGSFGDIKEHRDNKQDQSALDGFGSFKESGSIPTFDRNEKAHDEFQAFEQGFGSFSTDNEDCEIIDTKSCVDNSECSCYGLYQCNQGKCLSTQAFTSEEKFEEPDFGQWHAEPVQFDSWS